MRDRKETIDHLANKEFDVCVIGGGATGAGCALDAQLRGLKTVVIDAGDFASGSSSAATKMVHGGVRYIQEAVNDLDVGQYHLVEDALRERAVMLQNAPHLTRTVEFLVPCFSHFEKLYYGLGMKMYDWISGKSSLLPSRMLTRQEALYRMPAMQPNNLVGAVAYADGQFDDARYAMALIETFAGAGGEALNYASAVAFTKDESGKLASVTVSDRLVPTRSRFGPGLLSMRLDHFPTSSASLPLRVLRHACAPARGSISCSPSMASRKKTR